MNINTLKSYFKMHTKIGICRSNFFLNIRQFSKTNKTVSFSYENVHSTAISRVKSDKSQHVYQSSV